MVKKLTSGLLLALAIAPANAQRMLDIASGTFSPTLESPKVERTAPASTENRVVREDRTWRYYSALNCNMEPSQDIYLDVRFSGTTEIDGMEYSNCYVWKEEEEFSEENAILIAYMREENGKVYARYIPGIDNIAYERGIDIMPYAPMMDDFSHDTEVLYKEDVLLFDPYLNEGDVLLSTENNSESDVFKVVDVTEVECYGITRKAWTLKKDDNLNRNYRFFEGIGDGIGLLPMPGAVTISYGAYSWELVEVIDENGNPLFAPSKMTTGVENVGEEMEVVKEAFYDLNGVEINRPVSNGVYVKTQTLSNGATRTEKVMVK